MFFVLKAKLLFFSFTIYWDYYVELLYRANNKIKIDCKQFSIDRSLVKLNGYKRSRMRTILDFFSLLSASLDLGLDSYVPV